MQSFEALLYSFITDNDKSPH